MLHLRLPRPRQHHHHYSRSTKMHFPPLARNKPRNHRLLQTTPRNHYSHLLRRHHPRRTHSKISSHRLPRTAPHRHQYSHSLRRPPLPTHSRIRNQLRVWHRMRTTLSLRTPHHLHPQLARFRMKRPLPHIAHYVPQAQAKQEGRLLSQSDMSRTNLCMITPSTISCPPKTNRLLSHRPILRTSHQRKKPRQ